jgi:hypothetical protein
MAVKLIYSFRHSLKALKKFKFLKSLKRKSKKRDLKLFAVA